MSTTPTAATTTVPAPLPRLAGGGLAGPVVHACAHCHQLDTTAAGALWRVSPLAACSTLYYLHTACLAPYKVAHGLRSVEGRIPRSRRASASAKRTLIDGRWRGRIAHYPGMVTLLVRAARAGGATMKNIHRNHRAEIPTPLWCQLEARAIEKDTTPEYQLLQAIRMGLATQDALVSLVSRVVDASGLWVPDPPDAQPVEEEDAG